MKNANVKILPVKEPMIYCYTPYGTMFSILPESAMPWVMNNFIQLNYIYDWDLVTFDLHRQFMSNCPSIEFFGERRIQEGDKGRSLKDMIITGIDRGEYLYIFADRYYIKACTEQYHKYHKEHETFIFGYDLKEDLVYIGDNYNNGKFSFATCAFSEIEEAYANVKGEYEFLYYIRYLKVQENQFCRLNVRQILNNLDAYLNSKAIYDMIGEFSKIEYGIAAIDKILEKISLLESGKLDIRFFHLYYEHKLLMEMRVKCLMEDRYINESEIDIAEYSVLKNEAMILRNMVLKYNITQKREMLKEIYDKLEQIKKQDIKILLYLQWLLSRKCRRNQVLKIDKIKD